MSTGGSGGEGGTVSTGGGSASGGANGSGGTTPTDSLDGPIEREGLLVLEFDSLVFTVDPAFGGRIVSVRVGDDELLTNSSVHPENWGSTLWTSPQNDWGWPPPSGVDSDPYTFTVSDDSFHLIGPETEFAGKTVTVEKDFAADFERGGVTATYLVRNTGSSTFSLAAWEVSRVASGGLTFFPTGNAASTPDGSSPLEVDAAEGVTWFDSAAHPPDGSPKKLNADGKEGWVAHVTGDVLLIQSFTDLPASAAVPGDGEVEIFAQTAADGGYVEVENQGAYLELAPEASLSHTVTWIVRRVPANVVVEVGSPTLLAFVREQL